MNKAAAAEKNLHFIVLHPLQKFYQRLAMLQQMDNFFFRYYYYYNTIEIIDRKLHSKKHFLTGQFLAAMCRISNMAVLLQLRSVHEYLP
jgi:hypothetical protein